MAEPEPFSASKLKLQRASEHLAALEALVTEHFIAHPVTTDFTRDPVTNQLNMQTQVKLPPPRFSGLVGDTVHNLRAALDLMAVDLVRVQNGNTEGVYFPFCEVSGDLDEMIKRRNFHRAGIDAVNLLKQIKPYTGGNILLRALHDLDIADKHHALIPAAASTTTPQVRADMSSGSLVLHPVEGSEASCVLIFPDDWPLAREEVLLTLHRLVEETTGIVKAFATLSGIDF